MTLRSEIRRSPKIDLRSPAPSYVDEALGPGGHLSRVLPAFEARAGQRALARAVDGALRDKAHLLAEAPCGTGKGQGYLVPAIHHALERRKKVVVVTANINLQEQLARSDLPLLRRALPTPFTSALAKGRSNWLCTEAFEEHDGTSRDPRWSQVVEWAETTSTGDVAELPFEPGPLRRLFTVSAEDCMGKACPSVETCFAAKAKEQWAKADVIVTNYHLFLLDLVIRGQDPEAEGALPPWDVAVLDEAHELADIARELLGWRATRGSVDQVAQALGGREGVDSELAEDLRAEGTAFFSELLDLRLSDDYRARLRRPGEVDGARLAELLSAAAGKLTAEVEGAEPRRRERLRRGARQAERLAARVRQATALADPDRRAYSVELEGEEGRRRAELCCRLIWPADVLRPLLFSPPGRSVVLTSATLAVDGSFDYLVREVGADRDLPGGRVEAARELVVPSPFDFERQCLLAVPRGGPDPRERERHEQWVAERLVEVARLSRGRLLGLFSSWRGLKVAAEAMRRARGPAWGAVLVQGEDSRPRLVERLRKEVGAVLLGTDSFWQGVDVPGEALSVVVVDRLPFASPDDPVLDAVDAQLARGAFAEWSLPRAIVKLRQGHGRLIRGKGDRGAVVVLDDRVLTKGYGRQFLRALPRSPLTRDLADVANFLDGGKIDA